MILNSYLETGLETDPVWLGSGNLVIREEGEGPVVLGTPEGYGLGLGFCGNLNVPPVGLPLEACSSPSRPGVVVLCSAQSPGGALHCGSELPQRLAGECFIIAVLPRNTCRQNKGADSLCDIGDKVIVRILRGKKPNKTEVSSRMRCTM